MNKILNRKIVAWAYTFSFSTLLIFFLSPILGAAADFSNSKKKFLISFCLLGALSTGALSAFTEGEVWGACFFLVLGNIGFALGNVFYNAFLNEISTPETIGRVSGFGWALGYVGGGILLLINLGMIQNPEWFYIPNYHHLPTRAAFFSVSIWWILFSLPFFLRVREIQKPQTRKENLLRIGAQSVFSTLKDLKSHSNVFKFLIAYLIYNDGIETMIIMASLFGAQELHMNQRELILCFILIQAVAFAGSLWFGNSADRFGHKRTIAMTLVTYSAVTLWSALIMDTKLEFCIMGAMVGLILGGSQSASRSFLSLLIPKNQEAQFFGFFALTGKISNVIGPLAFGLTAQFYSLRAAIASLTLLFVIGLLFLARVQEPAQARA